MLPNLVRNDKKGSLFALRIADKKLQGAIWVEDPDLHVVAITDFVNTNVEDLDSLVQETDLILGQCVENLDEKYQEPDLILLGVPSTWMDIGARIQNKYRDKLKSLCELLELKPFGSVGVTEAVTNFLINHKAPDSFLLINIDHGVEICLVNGGVIVKSNHLKIENDLSQTIKEGFLSLETVNLPNQIYLMGVDLDLLPLKNQIENTNWDKINFNSKLTVSLLPINLPIEAIIYATQARPQIIPSEQAIVSPKNEEYEMATISEEQIEALDDVETHELDLVSENEFLEYDNDSQPQNLSLESEFDEKNLIQYNSDSDLLKWGFVRNADIKEITQQAEFESNGIVDEVILKNENKPIEPEEPARAEPPKVTVRPSIRYEKKRSFPWFKLLLGMLVLILLALGSAGGIWLAYSNSSAEIKLFVNSETYSAELEVTLDAEATMPDYESLVLNATILETEVSNSATSPTTGKDVIGQKATGTVTIFNDTDTQRLLDKGTKLTTTDKRYTFLLDSAVNIASKSVDLSSDTPFTPGKVTANVTAEKIGSNYNISAQTALNVANFSQSILIARADKEFVGGSSQEIQVVSKADQASLIEKLKSQLTTKAKAEIGALTNTDITIIDGSETLSWGSQIFNAKIGEQASTLTAEGTLKYSVVGYTENEFQTLAKSILERQIAQGFSPFGEMSMDLKQLTDTDKTDRKYPFQLVAKITVLPVVDNEKIKEYSSGKKLDDVKLYLQNLNQVQRAEIEIRPDLISNLLNRLPPNKNNISVATNKI